jgi:hypothetical protein
MIFLTFFSEWSDEIVYQETRKITIGLLQHFTYTQFIDAILGDNDVKVQSAHPPSGFIIRGTRCLIHNAH